MIHFEDLTLLNDYRKRKDVSHTFFALACQQLSPTTI